MNDERWMDVTGTDIQMDASVSGMSSRSESTTVGTTVQYERE
jgi:hypothetical protein